MKTNTNSDAIPLLVENHRTFLAFLTRRVGNRADAEEILLAAYVKGLERADTIRSSESAVAWFYRLLRNAMIDHSRHHEAAARASARLTDASEPANDPEQELEDAVCQCMHDLLPTLKEDYARLIRRVDLDGEAIAAVAAEEGLTPSNTRVKLHRARNALRRQLRVCCGTCAEHGCLDCDCNH